MRAVWAFVIRPRALATRRARPLLGGQWGHRVRFTTCLLHRQQDSSTDEQTNSFRIRKHISTPFDRQTFEGSMRKNLFYIPSFHIYQGLGATETRGLFDYGPLGCTLQNNIVDLWRKHFVLEEDMLEIDCSSLTPYEVLKSSGHVDRFTDWVCRDPTTGESFRADHLVKDTLLDRLKPTKHASKNLSAELRLEYESIVDSIDSLDGSELRRIIEKHNITSPTSKNVLEPPAPFNLMFPTNIGSSGSSSSATPAAYLRPETAQGQFVNFDSLFRFNQNALPFASASVGKCYRNEISPRAGLLRTREFLLAEIEHFLDPTAGKMHPRFNEVANMRFNLLDRETQASGNHQLRNMTVKHAVVNSIINNQTLAYFLARTQEFLVKCGIQTNRLRFRQHTKNEMAHYATDCWDAEISTSYGWIECVGCADRSAYDLTQHSSRTGQQLMAAEKLENPREVEKFQINIDLKLFGPHFKKDSKLIEQTLLSMNQHDLKKLEQQLGDSDSINVKVPGVNSSDSPQTFSIPNNMISVVKSRSIEHVRQFVPNVIEPSFGIGRILYALLEHAWIVKQDARTLLSLQPTIAPIKVLLATVVTESPDFPQLLSAAKQLASTLRSMGIACKFDQSGTSIGKKYVRADEMGVPLALTVDSHSMAEDTFTLRDRDTTEQVRASREEILQAIKNLTTGEEKWHAVAARLPKYGTRGTYRFVA